MNHQEREAFFVDCFYIHQTILLLYARRLLDDPSLTNEVVQEALLVAWKKIEAGESNQISSPRAWIFGVTRQTCWEFNRQRSSRSNADICAIYNMVAPDKPPEAEVIDRELTEAVHREVARLPESSRRIVELRCQGHPFQDIAFILERTPGACRVAYHRAIRHIQGNL